MGISVGQAKYKHAWQLFSWIITWRSICWGRQKIFWVLFWYCHWFVILPWKAHAISLLVPFLFFCLPWLFFFLIPFFFKSHQGWDCHILADCEVPCITLSQSPCRISTVPAVPYVNIWEFSKLKFRDPKVLKIVFQVSHSVLVFSWEFSKYVFYTKAQYAVIMTTTNCQSLRKKRSLLHDRVLNRRVSEASSG